VLLLYQTSILNMTGFGGPNRSIKTPASIAIRVNEVSNHPLHEKVTARAGGIYGRVKLALRPSNAKRLYMDDKSTEKEEIKA